MRYCPVKYLHDWRILLQHVSDQRDIAKAVSHELRNANRRVDAERRKLSEYDYFKSMLLAQYALEEANVGRAKRLLDDAPPDLRGWDRRPRD